MILISAMVVTAAVYAGIAHRHHPIVPASVQLAVQTAQVPKPAAGTPLNTATDADRSGTANDPNTESQQPNDTADDQNQPADSSQPEAANTRQGQASHAPDPQTVVYETPVHRIAKVRVVRVLQPAATAEAVAVDRPVTTVMPGTRTVSSPVVVPTGTPLTLRLDEPLGSKISQIDQSFSATLDRDVDVNGRTLIAAGAHVSGKVVFARAAGRISGEATLKLAVTSVRISRHEVQVATSVRSFGPEISGKNKVGRFVKGIAKRIDGEEREVLLAEQTAYTFNLSDPMVIR